MLTIDRVGEALGKWVRVDRGREEGRGRIRKKVGEDKVPGR